MKKHINSQALNLHAGEIVEVRSQEEILATLDVDGRLENLPFMPEMLQYCGSRLRVYRRAHKTCDNIQAWSLRRVKNAVHLEGIRCDGSGHGGCQAGCMIFWKEAWLKRIGHPRTSKDRNVCTTQQLLGAAQPSSDITGGEPIYSCQATELRKFSSHLPWWDLRHVIWDLTSQNTATNLGSDLRSHKMLEMLLSVVSVARATIIFMFNGIQKRRHNSQYPYVEGTQNATTSSELKLHPGELVQIKSKEEIAATLNTGNRNRGLQFEGEMLPYCSGIYRVLRRVTRIVDEKTGKMLNMKYPCIILDGVFCKGENHLCCSRAIYSYWRESWLRRVQYASDEQGSEAGMNREQQLYTASVQDNVDAVPCPTISQ